MSATLPVVAVLPQLLDALEGRGAAVLVAPPGAGKTTRVPLALLDAPWLEGQRIIMLEPRRLAARNAATYMARLLGEPVGRTVGYRIRHDTKASRDTRIEVVTEGVLARLLIDDPALSGTGIVVFDEFHERSIHADTGLALTLQARSLLRPELRVLVMSATLDAAPVAALLDGAPVIRSEGRAYPVETYHVDAPVRHHDVEAAVARTVRRALTEQDGDVLVFLPGAAEIRRVHELLYDLPPDVHVHRLHGSLRQDEQDAALAPAPPGARKVVLSSAIAETSLTIDGVRVVVDSGLMRVPRFSPRIGMTQLVTVRVSRASADQRRGRAGRTAPGACYRLWTRAEDATLQPQGTPEILEADLAPLALELAAWGTTDPAELQWLDPPPAGAFSQARELLRELDALDEAGRITAHGRALSRLPLHPRLAHMLLHAQRSGDVELACSIAALIEERDVFRASGEMADPDLLLRLDALQGRAVIGHEVDRAGVARARRTAQELRHRLGNTERSNQASDPSGPGVLLALAYPDRVGRARGGRGSFVLRNGRGARVPAHSALAAADWIVAAQVSAQRADSPVLLGAALDETDVITLFGGDIVEESDVTLEGTRVRARTVRRLGAIVLGDVVSANVSDEDAARAVLDAIGRDGIEILPWTDDARALRQRLAFLHEHDPAWPDVSDEALAETAADWLAPFLAGTRGDLARVDLEAALRARVEARLEAQLDVLAPTHMDVPSGSRLRIDYADPSAPVLAARLQELFGWTETPRIADDRVPLTIHLLSPAHRTVQVTRDLASFWRTGYFDVRRDLRGRYPKHYWPEDPLTATATRRVRPR